MQKFLINAQVSGDERLTNYFRFGERHDLDALLTQDFRSRLKHHDAHKPMLDFLKSMPKNISPLERMMALDQRFFLSDHNLIYTDKASMHHGVEVRVPFLDLDLMEFANSIPLSIKKRGFANKWI